MKGLFAILAAMVLAFTMACGGGQEGDSTTPTEESATTTETESMDDPAPIEEEAVPEEEAAPIEEEAMDEGGEAEAIE